MNEEEIAAVQDTIHSNGFSIIMTRVIKKESNKIDTLISQESERTRGWIEALRWVSRLPQELREEMQNQD